MEDETKHNIIVGCGGFMFVIALLTAGFGFEIVGGIMFIVWAITILFMLIWGSQTK